MPVEYGERGTEMHTFEGPNGGSILYGDEEAPDNVYFKMHDGTLTILSLATLLAFCDRVRMQQARDSGEWELSLEDGDMVRIFDPVSGGPVMHVGLEQFLAFADHVRSERRGPVDSFADALAAEHARKLDTERREFVRRAALHYATLVDNSAEQSSRIGGACLLLKREEAVSEAIALWGALQKAGL